MSKQTPLYASHLALGARMVDFHGWQMPLHYGSQLAEHQAVRQACGLFDVSHMQVLEVTGSDAERFLRQLLANDVARLTRPGQAQYGVMLNPGGGVIDDLITYYLAAQHYRLVSNAATRERVMSWLQQQAANVEVTLCTRTDLALLALQGPAAGRQLARLLGNALPALPPFSGCPLGSWFVATTGYTGEAGYEILLPGREAPALWHALLAQGVPPCGLGARDTLRLEAGLALYGQEMDEQISPLAANLGWTLAWEPDTRHFIGREALERVRNLPPTAELVGLLLEGRGVLRAGLAVFAPGGESACGQITSGSFSPTLGQGIALARVDPALGDRAEVLLRGQRLPVRVVKPAFVRHGHSIIQQRSAT